MSDLSQSTFPKESYSIGQIGARLTMFLFFGSFILTCTKEEIASKQCLLTRMQAFDSAVLFYDSKNQIVQVSEYSWTPPRFEWARKVVSYDSEGRVDTVLLLSFDQNGVETTASGTTHVLEYDQKGLPSKSRIHEATVSGFLDYFLLFTHNDAGWLTSKEYYGTVGELLSKVTFEYNEVGNVIQKLVQIGNGPAYVDRENTAFDNHPSPITRSKELMLLYVYLHAKEPSRNNPTTIVVYSGQQTPKTFNLVYTYNDQGLPLSAAETNLTTKYSYNCK